HCARARSAGTARELYGQRVPADAALSATVRHRTRARGLVEGRAARLAADGHDLPRCAFPRCARRPAAAAFFMQKASAHAERLAPHRQGPTISPPRDTTSIKDE